MKNEAEKTIKLLVNASKSYLVGTFNLRKAMFNSINFNHSNVLKITKEMQKVVEQSHFLSFSSKNNIIQAIANFYIFWEKGYIINLGNQWQVTRLVQQKDLGLEGTNRVRFGKSEVFFFNNQERDKLTEFDGYIILAQPLKKDLEPKFEFFDLDSTAQKQVKFINFTDIIGYSGEQTAGGIISASPKEQVSLIIPPASGRQYPLLDYMELCKKAERSELLCTYAQSKSREMGTSLFSFEEQFRLTNLHFSDLQNIKMAVETALQKTVKETGNFFHLNIGSGNSLPILFQTNPSFSLFMTGPYQEFTDPSKLLALLDEKKYKETMESYFKSLHGEGIFTRSSKGILEIYQNRVVSSRETSEENINTCLQASETVAVMEGCMGFLNYSHLAEELNQVCSLDREIQKIVDG